MILERTELLVIATYVFQLISGGMLNCSSGNILYERFSESFVGFELNLTEIANQTRWGEVWKIIEMMMSFCCFVTIITRSVSYGVKRENSMN